MTIRPIRRSILSLLLLAALAVPAAAAGLHHDLDVALDPAARRLEVTDRLRLSPGRHDFQLDPALTVTEASVGGKPLPVRRQGGVLSLTVPDGVGEVMLRYAGTLPELAAAARSGRAMLGAEGAFLPGLSGWLPSAGDEPPTWRLTVRVPTPFLAVATGRLVEEQSDIAGHRAIFAEDRPVEEPSLFAGPWQMRERLHDGLRLRSYFHPEQAGLSDEYLALTASAIDSYAARIGDYPFAGFAILSVPLPVGLGFPGLTAIGRTVLPLPFIRGQSLTHEILHNWWGNGVRVGPGGNWSEGLTTYMADYATAHKRDPASARAMRLDWLRDYAALPADRDQPVTAFRSKTHDASQIVGYGKVAMIFHMLEAEIGEAAFTAGLRAVWQAHRFREAGWADLRAAFEAAAGRDLSAFFTAWLDRPGAPSLVLAQAAAQGNAVTLTLRQEGPLYPLAVPVMVTTAAGVERHTVRLDGREATATLTVSAAPLSVAVDPDFDLFRRLAAGEAPPILRDVTLDPAARPIVAAEGEAVEAARALADRLLEGRTAPAGSDPAAPLLIVGTEAEVARELSARGLPAEPAETAGRGTARVRVLRDAAGRAVLVVTGRDAAALQALLRPLPHYGRQSWLVFDGAKAIERGVWPATSGAGPGALSHRFN